MDLHETGASGAIETLPLSARAVAEWLRNHGHPHPVVMLPQTGRSAAEAAAALGCDVAHIAKSIIFRRRSDNHPVLVIASGANRVDEKKVSAHTGPIGRADAQFVRDNTGYAIGGVCPVAHTVAPVTLIDADLHNFPFIWAAAGHPHAVFKLTASQLVQMTGAPVVDIAERRAD